MWLIIILSNYLYGEKYENMTRSKTDSKIIQYDRKVFSKMKKKYQGDGVGNQGPVHMGNTMWTW